MASISVIHAGKGMHILRQQILQQGKQFSFFDPTDELCHVIVARVQQNIVGLLSYRDEALNDPDYMELNYCEVAPHAKRQGIGTQLVKEFLTIVSAKNASLTVSPYEEEGLVGLKPTIIQECTKLGISFVEQGLASDYANNPDLW